jgi:hypothetical protein
MATMMGGAGGWLITEQEPGRAQTGAEIDIFKPDGTEIFVETAQLLPAGSPKHEECTGGLIDKGGGHRVQT